MNKEIEEINIEISDERRKEWVAALRSGGYDQDQGTLKTKWGFCCLGVATDLYVKTVPNVSWSDSVSKEDGHPCILVSGKPFSKSGFLCAPVAEWMKVEGPPIKGGEIKAWESALADLNDHSVSFSRIADVIESGSVFRFDYKYFCTRAEAEAEAKEEQQKFEKHHALIDEELTEAALHEQPY